MHITYCCNVFNESRAMIDDDGVQLVGHRVSLTEMSGL